MNRVTCANGCCAYQETEWVGEWVWQHKSPNPDEEPEYVECCPHTGERLAVRDGQPVVEPQVPAADLIAAEARIAELEATLAERPSPGYVRLLEAAVCHGDAVAAMLPDRCYRAVCHWHWARCEHGGIVECLRALAASQAERRETDGT